MPSKKSQEFAEKEKIEIMKGKREIFLHSMRMEELGYQRESEKIKHDHDMERQSIKSAEIRKMQERKAQSRTWGNN